VGQVLETKMIGDDQLLQIFETEEKRLQEKEIIINILGDFAPASGNTGSILAQKGKDYYKEIGKYFAQGDLNIVNLETTIDTEVRPVHTLPPQLVDSPEVLGSLQSINTNLATLANNHIFDNGPIGLQNTLRYLTEYGIKTIGAGFNPESIYKPYCFEKKDTKIGIVNIADGVYANEKYNDGVGAADIESYRAVDQIRCLKNKGYYVILIVHAGVVFMPTPPPFIQKLYREFIDLGVDVVVGHHPHVVQGYELYNNKPIFYSIGHFGIYRNYSRPQEKIGILLNLRFLKNSLEQINVIPFEISRDNLNLLNNEGMEHFKKEFHKLSILLNDSQVLENLWNIYVFNRQPILRFHQIAKEYKFNSLRSKTFAKGQLISYINRYLVSYAYKNHRMDNDPGSMQLLNKYAVIKSYKWKDRFFLMQENKLHTLDKNKECIFRNLKKLKKWLINVRTIFTTF
jgi:poly-gamma-glutamate capsule biosynthesis protein CapA/YwtB (metallophosphatase superfamily)